MNATQNDILKLRRRITKLEADLQLALARIQLLESRPPVAIQWPAMPTPPAPVPNPQPWGQTLPPVYIGDPVPWPRGNFTVSTENGQLSLNGKPVEFSKTDEPRS
jgi:hypothetical protein